MVARAARSKSRKVVARRVRDKASRVTTIGVFAGVSTVMEEARRAGLLDGDATEHVSFRAPKALIEAAKRESGATKPTELGLLALAVLAQPDPVASYLRKTRGKLGPDHRLDY